MLRKSLFPIVFVFALCAGAAADPPRPLLTVRKLAPGVRASQAIWSQPATVARFYFSKLSQRAGQRAEVRLAYDDANLYAAFRCLDSGQGKKGSVSPEGETVPDNDSASFLLDLDNDGRTYVMFTTTAAGSKSAESGRQFIRNPLDVEWSAETSKQGSTWTALMTIPFRSLGVSTPAAGTLWGAQLSRYDPGVKWPIFWARVRKDPREVQRCGDIVFAGADQVTAAISDIDVPVPGQQNMTLHVSNPTGKPAALKVQFINDSKTTDTLNVTAESGDTSMPLRFNYPCDGWHALTVAVTDSTGRLVARTPGIPVRMASYASRVIHYGSIARNAKTPSDAAAAEKNQVLTKLNELAVHVGTVKDTAQWNALRDAVDSAEKAVAHLRYACADRAGVGYVVGTETALRKIMRDKLFEGNSGEPALVELARNEFESTQIAVIAQDKALENVQVSVSDLKGPNAVIPADRIALNLVEFVETGEPPYEIDYRGWYPDPLMDYKPFDLARGGIRPVWITVHTPDKVPAGLYKGAVTIKPANAQESKIPLEVRVWDFAVPTTPHFKTAFAFFEAQYKGWYGKAITSDQRRQAYQLLLEHRLNSTNIYSKTPSPDKEDLPFCVEHGLNAHNLSFIGGDKNETVRAEIAGVVREQEKYLKEKGWWDKAYVYGFDELPSSKYPDLRNMFGWVKQQFPDLPRMCTALPNTELKGYVDIWVPLVANFDYEESQQYIKDGDQVWWYVCCGPERPWPNFFVDYPATDPRIIFWMNWKYQVPGFLYWTVNRWHSALTDRGPEIQKQIDAGKRWPEVPWKTQTTASFNGDGHLVYPGPGGKLLSSIRLESVRDGIDDYEYFYLLDSLLKQAEKSPNADKALLAKAKKLVGVPGEVVTSRTVFTTDPQVVLDARREVAEMIVSVSKAIQSR